MFRTCARRLATGAVLALVSTGIVTAMHTPALAANTTYYVDASAGADANSGLDQSHPWKSLSKINATTFGAGDKILLKAGSVWTGQLWPKGSGAAGSPIVIDSYGTGSKPRINGAGTVADAVRLFNQEYWTIRNLEVTNTVPPTGTPGANLGDFRGIHVSGDNSQTLDGFVIDAVTVHDVTGQVNWIGGDTADNQPGITFQTGWDKSKRTGGIVFDTTVPNIAAPPSTPTILNGITVQNSSISNTSFAGIVVKQYTGSSSGAVATGWGTRTGASDTTFKPHTNVTIRNNYITQAATAYGCNGIYLTDVRGGTIERNVVDKTGTSGIETYFADNVTIQFNEVFGTSQKAGGADSNGIDTDKGTTGQVVQYNYVHGNGDGILLCQFAFGNVVLRYNVITSNTRYQIYLHSDPAARAQIYNNTLYNDASNYLIYGYGTYLTSVYAISNNILYSTRANATISTGSTITYSHNLYGGATLTVPSGDTGAVVANPQFVSAPINAPSGTQATGPALAAAYELKVSAGSPAVNGGVTISGNGGRDYEGNTLYIGAADIGAFEQPTGSTTRYEAETAPAVCTGTIDSNWSGYSGSGFCNGDNAVGAYAQFTVSTPAAGTATLRVRFAIGGTTGRSADVIVNGSTAATVSFEATGGWSTWATKTLTVSLNAGSNTIRFNPTTSNGLANLDYLEVATTP
ncbi:right-handed parallel beta-helix repeat-containing protein [Hamadaea sp.]|uniref:carbohydrate-binding protein n=1 Tax=Hamadaea sp. TaxID=2024425 RepID=UPI0025C5C011|nr:right-handed parallel beta-helix repeat-containing protein [Hamadaea sp.]